MASQVRLPLMVLAIGLVAAGFATVGAGKDQDPNQDADWLGVIAGDEAGSEAELAAEMAELFANDSPFPVVPVPGDGGLKNISRLLHDPHIDAGFISTDVLAGAKTQSPATTSPSGFRWWRGFARKKCMCWHGRTSRASPISPASRSISGLPAAARR